MTDLETIEMWLGLASEASTLVYSGQYSTAANKCFFIASDASSGDYDAISSAAYVAGSKCKNKSLRDSLIAINYLISLLQWAAAALRPPEDALTEDQRPSIRTPWRPG